MDTQSTSNAQVEQKTEDAQAAARAAQGDASGAASASLNPKMLDRARPRLADPQIARDCQTLGGMVQIYCSDNHKDAVRTAYTGIGVQEGCYSPKRIPTLCAECAVHLEYGEVRRALCPKDPKPSCHTCTTHCYKPAEAQWQREVMRYAGPRAMFRGMFFDAIRHLRQEMRAKKIIESQQK